MSAVAKAPMNEESPNRKPQNEKGTPDGGGSSGNGSETATGGRKRESRAGTRKVTSLTADQLSRKRANDREAQRTIRRRTKQHIEHLEQQVAALSAKGEHMDSVLQHNAALEAEIAHLRNQLSMASGRPLYAVNEMGEPSRSTTSSPSASMLRSPFSAPHSASGSMPRFPAVPPISTRFPLNQGWHQGSYSPTPGSTSSADYSHEIEPYALENSLHGTSQIEQSVNSMTLAPDQLGYTVQSGEPVRSVPTRSESYQNLYQPQSAHPSSNPKQDLSNGMMHQARPYGPAQRSMSMPTVKNDGSTIPPHVQPTQALAGSQLQPGSQPLNYSWGSRG